MTTAEEMLNNTMKNIEFINKVTKKVLKKNNQTQRVTSSKSKLLASGIQDK